MSDEPAARHGVERLVGIAEAVIKVAAVVGVLGYMALRAHFNRLGVPAASVLDLPRYLAETYLFVASTTLHLVVVCAVLGLIVSFSRMVRRGHSARLIRWTNEHSESLLVLVLSAAYLLLRRHLDWPQDVAVGELSTDRLATIPEDDLFIWVGLVCAGGLYLLVTRRKWVSPALRYSAMALLAVLAMNLPLIYGHTMRPAVYPVVSVALRQSGPPVCGLLVLDTQDVYEIWRVEPNPVQNGRIASYGVFTRVPRADVGSARIGRLFDMLAVAREAIAHPEDAKPSCF